MHKKSIVCFYADGKTKYYEMTKYAVVSFLKNSTIPSVGILVPNLEIKKELETGEFF